MCKLISDRFDLAAWFLRQYRWVNGIPFVNEAKDIPALDLENDPMGGAA